MNHPIDRIILHPRNAEEIEILVVGDDVRAAQMYAAVKVVAEMWQGWIAVNALVFGGSVVGLICKVGPLAHHVEPLLEAYRMFRDVDTQRQTAGERAITWSDGMQTAYGEW